MNNFLDMAESYAASLSPAHDNKQAVNKVFETIASLQGVYAKSFLDLNNIESVFSVIQMGRLLGKLGGVEEEDIPHIEECLERLISFTLDNSTRLERVKVPRGGYKARLLHQSGQGEASYCDFVRTLLQNKFNNHGIDETAILSFNYDIALDYALHHHTQLWSYCLEGESDIRIPYLKLHGSLNWGHRDGSQTVVPIELKDIYQRSFNDNETVMYLKCGTIIDSFTDPAGHRLQGPVLVPPTLNKGEYQNTISNVWRKASSVLASAENIFIIGYSLPETDTFFRYLYAIGSFSDTRIKRFWVFNPDEAVESRFRGLIGRGIEDRFRFFKRTFAQSIKIIRDDGKE